MPIQHDSKKMSITDLLNREIVTTDGKKLGHVVDIELTRAPEFRLTALFYGSYGMLHRLHVLHPFVRRFGLRTTIGRIDWHDIECIEPGKITVRIHP